MAKPATLLPVVIDGQNHEVTIQRSGGQYHAAIDGRHYSTFRLGAGSFLSVNEDFPIQVDGETLLIAFRGKHIRLVHDGRYLDNGEEHKPAKPFPKWYWVFVVIHLIMIFTGGVPAWVLGLAGMGICGKIAGSGRLNTGVKVLLCCVCVVVVWVVLLFVVGLIYILLYGY